MDNRLPYDDGLAAIIAATLQAFLGKYSCTYMYRPTPASVASYPGLGKISGVIKAGGHLGIRDLEYVRFNPQHPRVDPIAIYIARSSRNFVACFRPPSNYSRKGPL